MLFEDTKNNLLSSTGAEYMAMAGTMKDVIFTQQIFTFIWPHVQVKKVVVHEDNKDAMHPANPMNPSTSKPIDIRHQFIRCKK